MRSARWIATGYRDLVIQEGLGEGDGEDLLPWEGEDRYRVSHEE